MNPGPRIVCVQSVAQSCLTLCDPMDHSLPGSFGSREFSRQEYWSRLPLPSPGDLPDPGIKPVSPGAPALGGRFFITMPPVKTPEKPPGPDCPYLNPRLPFYCACPCEHSFLNVYKLSFYKLNFSIYKM